MRVEERWRVRWSLRWGPYCEPRATFTSYGEVPAYRQAEILNALATAEHAEAITRSFSVKLDDDQVRQILDQLVRANVAQPT